MLCNVVLQRVYNFKSLFLRKLHHILWALNNTITNQLKSVVYFDQQMHALHVFYCLIVWTVGVHLVRSRHSTYEHTKLQVFSARLRTSYQHIPNIQHKYHEKLKKLTRMHPIGVSPISLRIITSLMHNDYYVYSVIWE